MKRKGFLYESIYNIENLKLAEKNARKGKQWQTGVIQFDKNAEDNIINLYHVLKNQEYRTSKYTVFKIFEGKEREICRLPYYPDRIVHHSIMNVLEPIFVATFTSNTYSCIKKRGIHKCANDLKKALRDKTNTQYCLKLDIKKFYPSIKHTILKELLARKFKDPKLIALLNEIIDSINNGIGIPIGNYISQFLANFYLSAFDHWIKETLQIKYYFRYCDDIVILGKSKDELHSILFKIQQYLHTKLELSVKPNHQVFPINSRGIDFVGYRFYHTHTLLRKRIKKNFIRMIKYNHNAKSIASYNGWLTHCNSINIKRKYIKQPHENIHKL